MAIKAKSGMRTVSESLADHTMSVPEYAQVVGISRDHAYALAARDELGVRILRFGQVLRVPTAEVRRLIGDDEPVRESEQEAVR